MGLLCTGLTEPIELNRFNCVRLSSVSKLNRRQSNGLSSICSEIELTESLVFDFVRLPNSIKLNPRIERSTEFDFRAFDLLCRVYLVWAALKIKYIMGKAKIHTFLMPSTQLIKHGLTTEYRFFYQYDSKLKKKQCLKSSKTALKETQNNMVKLQTQKDRKAHYIIG